MQKSFFESNIHLELEQIQKLELYISELVHFNQKFSLFSPQPTGRKQNLPQGGQRSQLCSADGDFVPSGSRDNRESQREKASPLSAIHPANQAPFNQKGQSIPPLLVELVVDSLVAGRLLLKKALPGPIADIGSGAGFPGLVLALLDPDREFWLYEVHKKKAGFLEHITWKLNLKNVKVKNIPIQEEKPDSLNQAVSKAFFSLPKRLELTKSIFKGGTHLDGGTRPDEGARYYHLQSLAYEREWAKLSPRLKRAWTLAEVEKYSHPLFSERVLLTTIRQPPT